MTGSKDGRDAGGFAKTLTWIWVAGAAVRLAFIFLEPKARPVADETMWLMALTRIKEAGFSPFANYPIFHPPIYPYFLAGANAVFGTLTALKILQALFGSLLIPTLGQIGRRVFGARAGLGAAVLAAFYPDFVWYSAHFWCETVFIAILWRGIERALTAEALESRGLAFVAGVFLGFAALTRETALYLVPVVAIWLASAKKRESARLAALMVSGALLVVVPWTVRNAVQFRAFIPISTGGGLNLYQGNAGLSRPEVYIEYYKADGKVEQFERARAEAIKAILDRQPWWIFEKVRDEGPLLAELDSLALIHIRRGAYGEIGCGVYRASVLVVVGPWVLIALCGVLALSRLKADRGAKLLVAIAVVYLLLHIASHGFARYRLPVVPVAMLFAASLLDRECAAPSTGRRNLALAAMTAALVLLWTSSFLDQLGFMGYTAAPTYEGFAPVCP